MCPRPPSRRFREPGVRTGGTSITPNGKGARQEQARGRPALNGDVQVHPPSKSMSPEWQTPKKADQDQFKHPSLPTVLRTVPYLLCASPVTRCAPNPLLLSPQFCQGRRPSPALISQSVVLFSLHLTSPHDTSPHLALFRPWCKHLESSGKKNTTHARCPRDIKRKGNCAHHAHLQRSLSINALSHEFQAILTLLQRSAPAASLRRTFYSR